MPYLDPEKKRENRRKYHLANIEKIHAASRQWRLANPERYRANIKRWQTAHPEKVNAYGRRWTADNPEKVRAKRDRWRANNKQREYEVCKKWRENNPDKVNGYVRVKNNLRRAAEGKFGLADIRRIFVLQKGRCAYFSICGTKFKGREYHIDHIVPIARGGTHWPSNLQLTCKPCNHKKFAKPPEVFARALGLLL